jgi:hypothetical protein
MITEIEMNEIIRIVNRHKARILSQLEDAGCPSLFVQSVSSNLNWMRSDLASISCDKTKEQENDSGNIGNK